MSFISRNHPQQVDKRGALDEVDDRGTDPVVFAELAERFGGFTLDVAAAEHNAKTVRWFGRVDDGLVQSWVGERVWCNPPYSDIAAWVSKAHAEAARCPLIVMLLPANRTEQRWWQDLIEPTRDRCDASPRVEFLRGRMRFIRPGAESIGANERPPFGVCLVVWRNEATR